MTVDELYDLLLRDGMRDPLVVAFGRDTRRLRLDEGNQRVRLFARHGISYVPVIGVVDDTHIIHPQNGVHEGAPWEPVDPLVRNGRASVRDLLPSELVRSHLR